MQGGAGVIRAKIVKDEILVKFPSSPATVADMLRVPGARQNILTGEWKVPLKSKDSFEKIMSNYLIVWAGEKVAGGIQESTISKYPNVKGYEVIYKDGKIDSHKGFKTAPWDEFQVKGFNCLVERPFLILADDAGLGKTYQVTTAIEARKRQKQLQRGVVLCKSSLLYNWRDEIHRHTNCKAVVMSGTVKARSKLYAELEKKDDWTFLIISFGTYKKDHLNLNYLDNYKPLDFVVIDEAHVIKNPLSDIGKKVHYLPFKYKYLLTATPIPNNPLEAYNYLKLGGKTSLSWWQFRNRYACWGGYKNKEIVSYKNMKELKSLIQDNMLRRLKKDKLHELPDVVFKTVTVEMTQPQKRLYRAVVKEIKEDLKDTSLEKVPEALAKLVRLQQITDSPALIGGKGKSAKMEALDETLEEIIGAGHKVIVFSRFRTLIEMLQKEYAAYNPAVIHGGIDSLGRSEKAVLKDLQKHPMWEVWGEEKRNKKIQEGTLSERHKEVNKFQNDTTCKLFLGCAPACREGLTLTAASYVVFIDTEWTWDYLMQAYSRAHRIGQKNPVHVTFLACKDSIDEKILEVAQTKAEISEEVLGINLSTREFIEKMLS